MNGDIAIHGWRSTWQQELNNLLGIYRDHRQRNPFFLLALWVFFILINTLCFWIALATAFPELIDQQPVRMFKIQLPVALLGGLFDSASFFITLWLIYQASRTNTGLKFVSILSVDVIIAVIATAWVLLIVILSSWIIGPPELPSIQNTEVVSLQEQPEAVEVEDVITPIAENTALPLSAQATLPNDQTPATEIQTVSMPSTKEEPLTLDTAFYQNMLVNALENPFENYRYFWFGIIMGFSTLLPTFFHIFMAFHCVWLTNSGKSSKLLDL